MSIIFSGFLVALGCCGFLLAAWLLSNSISRPDPHPLLLMLIGFFICFGFVPFCGWFIPMGCCGLLLGVAAVVNFKNRLSRRDTSPHALAIVLWILAGPLICLGFVPFCGWFSWWYFLILLLLPSLFWIIGVKLIAACGGTASWNAEHARRCSDDKSEVFTTVAAIANSQDPKKMEVLLALMKDRSDIVRAFVAEALGELANPQFVEPLIGALWDGNIHVRLAAVKALDKLRDQRAVEDLINALGDAAEAVGDYCSIFLSNAIEALSHLADPRAVEPLIKALGNAHGNVRKAAVVALGSFNDPRAVEPLIMALGDDYVEQDAAIAISHFDETKWSDCISADCIDFCSLGDSNSAGTDTLTIRSLPDVDGHGVAAAPQFKLAAYNALTPLIKLLNNKDLYVVAEMLGYSVNVRGVQFKSFGLSTESIKVLGTFGDARAVQPLLRVLGSFNHKCRRAASEALGKLGQPQWGLLISVWPKTADFAEKKPDVFSLYQWDL